MGNYKILVVDDELGVCQFLKDFLSGAGYEVFIAHDGAEGLLSLKENKPDLAPQI